MLSGTAWIQPDTRFLMDVIFSCPSCKQQLEADSAMAGNEIECPSCATQIVIPEPDPANVRAHTPAPQGADGKHFVVPISEGPSASLIQKPKPTLETTAKTGDKELLVKTIRRSDCVEVGKDHFDEMAAKFLQSIGQENIISMNTVNYSHLELGTRALVNDYGLLIVYRG